LYSTNSASTSTSCASRLAFLASACEIASSTDFVSVKSTTSWSNVPADFNLHTLDGSDFSVDSVVSGAKSITLSGGSGTTSVSCQQPSNGNIELKFAYSTSGDPGTNGTANSGSGYGNTVSGISFTSGTLYLRFKLAEVKADSGNLNTAENRTITFTNNGVSNTDLQINCRLSGL